MLLHNRNKLEEVKNVGFECEDMARDIKFNLRSQTDKLENSTLKNLFSMQKGIGQSNRLVTMIKSARLKNKVIMYGIMTMLCLSILFIIYISFFAGSDSEVVVHDQGSSS